MAASFPGAVKTFTTKTDGVDKYLAAHVNDLQAEVNAIEAELGTDPAGTAATLKARLAVSIADDGAVQKGTSNPGSPVACQLFYRTDTDQFQARNAANNAWNVIGSGANGIFCFGEGHNYSAQLGTYAGTSLVPTSGQTYNFFMAQSNSGDYRDIINSKWTRVSGVQTVTCHCWIWQTEAGAGYYSACKVTIGSVNGSVNGTTNQVTPEYKTFTIDVSSLTAGTTYDVTISLLNSRSGTSSSSWAYLSHIIAFGS